MGVRRIDDRFEWLALSGLTPNFTHHWSWALQCAERFRRDSFFKVDMNITYLRVWADDRLFGCPFIIAGDINREHRAFNVPRSSPALLNGGTVAHDPAAVIRDGWPTVELFDDTTEVHNLARRYRRLVSSATEASRSVTLNPATKNQIAVAVGQSWAESLERVWRGSWTPELFTYRAAGRIIGWSCHVHHNGNLELVAVARPGRQGSPWVSPRVPQSSHEHTPADTS